MRKLFTLPTIAAFAMSLAACDENNETPQQEITTEQTTIEQTTTQQNTTTQTQLPPEKIETSPAIDQDTSQPETDNFPFSTERTHSDATGYELTIQDVRVGTHGGYDRVVFEFGGTGDPGWTIQYEPDPRHQASGYPFDKVPGSNAYLQVMIHGTPMGLMWPDHMMQTGLMGKGAGNIKDVMNGSAFEGDSQFIVNLDEEKPFHVFVMHNPTRLVIDFQQ